MTPITPADLTKLYTGYKALFNKAMAEAPTHYKTLAMVVPSTTAENQYGWLAAQPAMREWLGDRIVHGLSIEGFTIRNKEFEATVSVPRKAIEDDQYGLYGPLFEKMGRDAAMHPEELVLSLLAGGFTTNCYDGQSFFDTNHPVGGVGDYPVGSVSNNGGGSGTAWFLLDCSQPIKPMVWQERIAYQMTKLDQETDDNVFFRNEYVYGVRARGNAGYGLWQLAYASKQTLNAANYAAARAAMMDFRKDNGKPLRVRPTHMVVPPSLEASALEVLKAVHDDAGASNVWAGTAELIVSPDVA